MYYIRFIVNFKKTADSAPYCLHVKVDIKKGEMIWTYMQQNYFVAYGLLGKYTSIDPGLYDQHSAFVIKPTEVVCNVDLDMNSKNITNIRLDQTQNNSVPTVKMLKDLESKVDPYTRNNVYRELLEQFYDFSDASSYKLTLGSSGITFTGINPNITFPQRTITHVNVDGLRFQRQTLNLSLSHSPNFTICVVMQLWLNKRFMIEFQVTNAANRPRLIYGPTTKKLFLETNSGKTHIPLTNDFNGKKVVF